MHSKDNQACICVSTNTVWLLTFLLENDKNVVLQTSCLCFYLLNILFVNNNPKTSTESLCRNPVRLLSGLPIKTRGPPRVVWLWTPPCLHLPPQEPGPASTSYVVQALSACLVGPWSHHTLRGLELLPSPGSDVSTTEARLKDTRSVSRHIRKAPCTTHRHHCP